MSKQPFTLLEPITTRMAMFDRNSFKDIRVLTIIVAVSLISLLTIIIACSAGASNNPSLQDSGQCLLTGQSKLPANFTYEQLDSVRGIPSSNLDVLVSMVAYLEIYHQPNGTWLPNDRRYFLDLELIGVELEEDRKDHYLYLKTQCANLVIYLKHHVDNRLWYLRSIELLPTRGLEGKIEGLDKIPYNLIGPCESTFEAQFLVDSRFACIRPIVSTCNRRHGSSISLHLNEIQIEFGGQRDRVSKGLFSKPKDQCQKEGW